VSKKPPDACVVCGQPLAPGHDLLCADCLKLAEKQRKQIKLDELIRISKEYTP